MTVSPSRAQPARLRPEPFTLTADHSLRLRRLETQMETLAVAVKTLADALDRTDQREAAEAARALLDELRG